jgi:hypothetical protein
VNFPFFLMLLLSNCKGTYYLLIVAEVHKKCSELPLLLMLLLSNCKGTKGTGTSYLLIIAEVHEECV